MPVENMPCADCRLGRFALYGPTFVENAAKLEKFRAGVRAVKGGQHVVRMGEPLTRMYTIRSGWAFRYVLLEDGRRQILEFLLPGDMITLDSLYVGDQPLDTAIKALTDLTLCEFDLSHIKRIATSTNDQTAALGRLLRERTGKIEQTLADVGRRRAVGRLAQFILRIHDTLLARGLISGPEFECPIRREHIADALGLTAAHVNRTLALLERANAIRVNQRNVQILDLGALREFARD